MDSFFLEEDFSDSDSLGFESFPSPRPHIRNITPLKSFEPLINQIKKFDYVTSLPMVSSAKILDITTKNNQKFTFKLLNNNQINVFTLLPINEKKIAKEDQASTVYVSWVKIENPISSLLTTVVLNKLKEEYREISSRFVVFSCEKHTDVLKTYIERVRKDDLFASSFFHFISYGKSKIEGSSISTISNTTSEPISIPLETIFSSLGPNSLSIFDGNYSGKALTAFLSLVRKDSGESTIAQGKFLFSDCYCLCSSSPDEEMPKNKYIPCDFLTSVLLSPVRMAILCHFLKYHKEILNSSGLSIFDNIPHDFINIMNNEINAITECIVSEFISKKEFVRLFKKDEVIAVIFKRFILCQYLLDDFNVHPISYPELPQMQKHKLWAQLTYSIDYWLISRSSPNPIAENNLFHRAVSSFFKNFYEKQDHQIVALTAIMQGLFDSTEELIEPLAYFASLSEENKNAIIPFLHFGKLFSVFFRQHISLKMYHACAYLILSSDKYNSDFSILLTEHLNISRLQEIVTSKTYPASTRALSTAILAKLVLSYQMAHNACITSAFFNSFSKILKESESQPLLWLLILLKKIWCSFSIDQCNFIEENVHLHIASLITHNSYEVRAAAVTATSVFMQTTEQVLNRQLFYLLIPAAIDMSYIVRYQFLMFIIRFIASRRVLKHKNKLEPRVKTVRMLLNYLGGTPDFYCQFVFNFMQHEKDSFEIANAPNAEENVIETALFLLDYFSNDPCKLVKDAATKAKELFYSKTKRKVAPPFNSSIQNPLDIPAVSLSKGENYEFPNDSDALFSYAYEQLSKAGQWNSEVVTECQLTHNTRRRVYQSDCDYLPSRVVLSNRKVLNDKKIRSICFYPEANTLICAHSSTELLRLDDGLSIGASLNLNSNICDVITKSTKNDPIVICSTTDGSVYLCDMEDGSVITSFRAGFDYKFNENKQKIASHENSCCIATANSDNGVCLWDIETQKLVGEWKSPDLLDVTSLSFNTYNEKIAYLGLSNGALSQIDFRMSQINTPIVISNDYEVECDNVINMTHFNADGQTIYAGLSSGRILSWDIREDKVMQVGNAKSPLVSFDAHQNYPMLICSSENEKPYFLTPNSQFISSIYGIGNGSLIAPHQTMDLIAFADEASDIQIFELFK